MNTDEPAGRANGVDADLVDSPGLRDALVAIASRDGSDLAELRARSSRYLRELRTGHDARLYGWLVRAGRALLRSGYSAVDYDAAQVARVRDVLRDTPAVVLSSHKSYLDGGALTVGFHEHGLPPLTVFGGINMSFWPLGSLWRRAGMVFIRRGGDDPVYRATLRRYLAHLVSQRRPLQWFIEGTRSRTGKLGPPRVGLLSYLVDAYREGGIEDLAIVPVSVTYDQLQEVAEYASEARGAAKTAESLGWLLRFVRSQRGSYGSVYVRFGAPISLRASLGSATSADHANPGTRRLALQKLAFGIACGINDSIPITGAALVTLALLGARGRALTLPQLRAAIPGYIDFAHKRALPLAPTAALDSEAALRRVLDGLVGQGVASVHDSGELPVYGIERDRHLAAAYYRNSIVHHFLDAAIAELALLEAAEETAGRRLAAFDAEALDLRDLLKFDFFFRDRAEFLAGVHAEISRLAPDWRDRLAEGPEGVQALLERVPTLCSDMLLRSFFEAYSVAAEATVADATNDEALLDRCMGLGQQYVLQGRLHSPEAVSRHLYRSAIELARNRGLAPARPDPGVARDRLLAKTRSVLQRLGTVHRIAVRRVERSLSRRTDPCA